MGFINIPNLPNSKVSKLIAGQGVLPFADELKKLNIDVLLSDTNDKISSSLKDHADLNVCYLGNGKLLLDSSQNTLCDRLKELDFTADFITESVKEGYPSDCLLNAAITEKTAICNSGIIAEILNKHLIYNNYQIIETNQGYSKCSVCVVADYAFITDDENIYKALNKAKKDVLLVKKGSIALNGFNYGFIGGCCGMIAKDIIAFCGDIKKHSDYNNIKSFANNYGVSLQSLGNGELKDIGGLIPIYETEV